MFVHWEPGERPNSSLHTTHEALTLEINSGLCESNMNLQSQETVSASDFDLSCGAPCLTSALSGTLALSRPQEGPGCSVPYPPV